MELWRRHSRQDSSVLKIGLLGFVLLQRSEGAGDAVLSHPLDDPEGVQVDSSSAKSGAEWKEERVVWSSMDVPLLVTHSPVRRPIQAHAYLLESGPACLPVLHVWAQPGAPVCRDTLACVEH